MTSLAIDRNKCIRCGLCAAVCTRGIIVQETDDFPSMVPGMEAHCIHCGHCVAVCAHGAADLDTMPAQACPPVEERFRLDLEQAEGFLRSRRSIRAYHDEPVDHATLRRLIEIARYAPTGGNSQEIHWTVHTDREKLRTLSELTIQWMRRAIVAQPNSPRAGYFGPVLEAWQRGHDIILRDAPALVTASAPAEASTGFVDLSIALTYLDLSAPSLGLGTCWAGLLQFALLNDPATLEALELPEGHPHYYSLMVGRPVHRYHRLPVRKPPPITWR